MMVSSEYIENWITQIRKGVLSLIVLNFLNQEAQYGYELSKSLSELANLGVTEATIYPLLSRLRIQGLVKTSLVESKKGPARKYYSVTAKGRKILKAMNEHLSVLCRTIEDLQEG